jgi:DNA-binding response OmpR family regulator
MSVSSPERVTAGPLRTLLVDDERKFGEGLVELLDDFGFDADFVTTAEEAEPLTEDHDVVVVDLNLPDMSGKELAERIQVRHPAKWILLLTARKVLKEEIEQSGTVRYVGLFDKPLVLESLREFRQTLNELQKRKESTARVLNEVLANLEVARNVSTDVLDRQDAFVNAKQLIRGEVQDRFRERSESRRQIALMLRVAANRLSIFPSTEFALLQPTERHFDALKHAVLLLGRERISPDDEVAMDRELEAAGLTVRLEVSDPSTFFSHEP